MKHYYLSNAIVKLDRDNKEFPLKIERVILNIAEYMNNIKGSYWRTKLVSKMVETMSLTEVTSYFKHKFQKAYDSYMDYIYDKDETFDVEELRDLVTKFYHLKTHENYVYSLRIDERTTSTLAHMMDGDTVISRFHHRYEGSDFIPNVWLDLLEEKLKPYKTELSYDDIVFSIVEKELKYL